MFKKGLLIFLMASVFINGLSGTTYASNGKKVFADYHGYRYTRENDGQLGNWKTALKSSSTSVSEPYSIANYNADIIDANGKNELAAMSNPLVGMQSYNDEDYLEYQVLTAKMAGIDGFIFEYASPNSGLTDSDLQKLQAVAEKYNFEIGIDWLDAQYYDWITNNADYIAWCNSNGKTNTDTLAKTQYIQVVYQKLIDWVYNKPNAATINGKPVMLQFNGNDNVFNGDTLNQVKGYKYNYNGQSNVTSPFMFLRRAPMGLASSGNPDIQKFWSNSVWENAADGTFGWKPATERAVLSPFTGQYDNYGDERDSKEFARAHVEGALPWVQNNGKTLMAGVMPGFDNKYCSAWGAWSLDLLDRKNGSTYEEAWKEYLKNKDNIASVLVATWSDHTEGSGIEPLETYGYREVRANAKYAAEFKGNPDNSTSLDFTLPEKLFTLRKKVKLLERAGFPTNLLENSKALLDTSATDISNASYTNATTELNNAEEGLNSLQASKLKITTYTSQHFTNQEVTASSGVDQYINIDNSIADRVRSKYFEGNIQFEYKNDSIFSANKNLYLVSYPTPVSTGKPYENRSVLMDYRFGNGDNSWKTAKVKLDKANLRLDSHVAQGANTLIDMYFSGSGTIKNATVSFTTYEYQDNATASNLTVGTPTLVNDKYQVEVGGAQPNEQVTILVSKVGEAPVSSNIIYVNQETSNAQGMATFNFLPRASASGTYTVKVSSTGENVSNTTQIITVNQESYTFTMPEFINNNTAVKYTYTKNISNPQYMPHLVVAYYNGNKLLNVVVEMVETSLVQVGSQEIVNVNLNIPANTTAIKAFVLDGANKIKPLTISNQVSLN